GCITACTSGEQAVVDGVSVCHYVDSSAAGWFCNGTPDDPPGCTPACSPSLTMGCQDAYCTDRNIPGCITACTSVDTNGAGLPTGCVFQDKNNGLASPWWICSTRSVD